MSSPKRQQQQQSCRLRNISATLSFILLLVGFSFFVYLRSFLALDNAIFSSSSFGLEAWPIAVVVGGKPLSQTLENVSSAPPVEQQQVLVQVAGRTSREAASGVDLQELVRIVSEGKRRQWLRQHWSEVAILAADETSELFERRVRSFLRANCSHTFFTIWISEADAYGVRETRCMQSIFRHHPHACVVIVSRSLDTPRGGGMLQPFVDRGYRVMAAAPDVPFLFSGTPAQMWLRNLKKGRVDPGEIPLQQNLSNILRLLLLYKFGGVYLDSDVLMLNSLANLSNVIGAQSEDARTGEWYRLNNAVLVFDREHPVVYSFIKEFAFTFNGSKWGHNGPYLATRVLMRLRKGSEKLGCGVMRTRAFYPVSWNHIPQLFGRPEDETWKEAKVQSLLNESYCIHLWNRETRMLEVQRGSVIDELFKSQCVLCDSS